MKKIIVSKILPWSIVGLLLVGLWTVLGLRILGEERPSFPPISSECQRSRELKGFRGRAIGYIDRNGEWAIAPKFFEYLWASPFSSGVARVSGQQGDCIYGIGYINPQGKYTIPPSLTRELFSRDIYDHDFSEGLLPLRKEPKGKIGFIDTTGKFVIRPQFDSVEGFHEGLALVSGPKKFGYIDRTGKLVIPSKYGAARSSFQQGVAVISRGSNYGLIDRKGNLLMEPILDSIGFWPEEGGPPKLEFHSGLLGVRAGEPIEGSPYTSKPEWAGKWGYVAKSGGWAIEPQFIVGAEFSEGRAVVVQQLPDMPEGTGLQVLIDTEGNIIETQNQEPKPLLSWQWRGTQFHEGLAAAITEEGLAGYIDREGRWEIAPQFANAGYFSDGLAVVETLEGKDGYIDRTGTFAIAPQFDWAEDFNEEEGLAIVHTQCKYIGTGCQNGIINKRGEYILPPEYDFIDDFVGGVAGITQGELKGYVDNKGRIIAEPQFDRAEDFSEGLGLVTIYKPLEREGSSQ